MKWFRESPEVVDKSPRMTRHAFRRWWPVRVMEPPVENIPVLTIQDTLAVAGAVVLDCRPSLLPVSIDICGGNPNIPDLSRQGPFDVHQDRSASGASPQVLAGMQGCQYRMTSYDEQNGGPDFSLAYGIQLHDPRVLEDVGAPESARLLSRSPEYWHRHLV